MKNIDFFAYKIEAYDLDDFISSVERFDSSIVFIFNPSGGEEIYSNLSKISKNRVFLNTLLKKNLPMFYKFFFFPIFFLDLIITALRIFTSTHNSKIKLAYVDNTYVASIFVVLKKLHRIDRLIYASHDWLYYQDSSIQKKIFGRFFLLFDKWIALNADEIICHTEEVRALRESAYQKYNLNQKVIFPYFKIKDNIENTDTNKIVFLGLATEFSGVEVTLNSIDNEDFNLYHYGPESDTSKQCSHKSKNYKYMGMFSRKDLCEKISNSLLGVNIVISNQSHTALTIPSKVIDYLRCGLPVVITKESGPIYKFIEKYQLGIVVQADKGQVIDAINKIRSSSNIYRKNIQKFFQENNVGSSFEEIFKF